MAPKEKFPKEMADWFKSVYPEFDAKLGINKPQLPGQPVPTNDPNLRLWKKEKRDEFENKFADTLNQVDDWRGVSYPSSSFTPPLSIYLPFQQRFDRKFINRKRDIKDANIKSSPPKQELPVLVLHEPSATTGRKLFEHANTDKFSEEATQRRDALGQTAKSHAGHWQSIASAAWKALSDEERAQWEEKAHLADLAENMSGDVYK
jgi:hypothetical protein